MLIPKCLVIKGGKKKQKNKDEKFMKWTYGPEKAKGIDKRTPKLTLL